MEKNNSDIFIISGEKSGDIHGSYIIENLLKSFTISDLFSSSVVILEFF